MSTFSPRAMINLPHPLMPFLGRSQELSAIGHRLANPACQLVTLLGPGGCGKTRLAIEAARQHAGLFPHGVYFVPLAPLNACDGVIPAIASALQLPFGSDVAPRQRLLDVLVERQLLLVLDNFEHLLDSTELLIELLNASPRCKLLVTSREPLRLQEEWLHRLDGLDFPNAIREAPLETYSAIQLFVERAKRVNPDFSLADNRDSVVQICRLVNGMPLSIELAVAWLKTVAPIRIVQEIQNSLDFLESPLRNIPERHRSLRAVFDHSWRLLSGEAQQVFAWLSVFRGGFTAEAAAAVAGAQLRELSALVDKSLLTLNSIGRYDLHELLRQYGEEKLVAAGKADAARDAHSRYFADFLRTREADLKGRRLLDAVREIRADFDNISSAWSVMVMQRSYDQVDRATVALFKYGIDHHPVALVNLFRFALANLAPLPGEMPHRAWGKLLARNEYMILAPESGYHDAARDDSVPNRALAIARLHDDATEMGFAIWLMGLQAASQYDFARAKTCYQESLTYYERAEDEFYIAEIHYSLGLVCHWLRQTEEAESWAQQSLTMGRQIGDKNVEGWSLTLLGLVAINRADAAEAVFYLRSARVVHDETGTPMGAYIVEFWLMMLALLRADFEEAEARCLTFAQEGASAYPYIYLNTDPVRIYQAIFMCLDEAYSQSQNYVAAHPGKFQETDPAGYAWWLLLIACGTDDYVAVRHQLDALQRLAATIIVTVPLFFSLPAQALLLAHEGTLERAVELLALASRYPDLTAWMQRWGRITRLRTMLETTLSAEAFAAAWNRGVKLDFKQALTTSDTAVGARPLSESHQTLAEPLSERELEVLRLIAGGFSNSDIAQHLYLTVGTIKTHARNIFGKLGVSSRTQAVAQAQKLNLL